MPESIVTTDLTKYYNSFPGLVGLDLSVLKGEVFGFLGPNGAGKTTTIRLLMDLIRPTRGRVLLMGHELHKNRLTLLQHIGYLPGEVGFYGDLTGDEYLTHCMKLRMGGDDHRVQRKLTDLKGVFSIDYTKKIGGYSKGMRQILGIIQAFMHDPNLIILDEPTSGLDPVMQERFYKLVKTERDRGHTVFLSSHNLNEVERVCDRVGFIKKGTLMTVERLDGGGSLAGKKVRVVVDGDTKPVVRSLDRLSHAHTLAVEGETVRFFFTGEVRDLIEWAGTVAITDFVCEPPTVEDYFISLYGE
jgi:ABC-2 type transport system ATP-binding protein